MDCMLGLPSAKHGNKYIFVVANNFYKMAILTKYKKNITRKSITNKLLECVLVHFMLPWTIISYIDNKFLGT